MLLGILLADPLRIIIDRHITEDKRKSMIAGVLSLKTIGLETIEWKMTAEEGKMSSNWLNLIPTLTLCKTQSTKLEVISNSLLSTTIPAQGASFQVKALNTKMMMKIPISLITVLQRKLRAFSRRITNNLQRWLKVLEVQLLVGSRLNPTGIQNMHPPPLKAVEQSDHSTCKGKKSAIDTNLLVPKMSTITKDNS